MNLLDSVILLAAVAAGIGGWRFGFIARLLAWGGVALGLMIGIRFVPGVVTAFGGTAPDDRVTVALLFLVLVATLGQGIGLAVGALVHRARPDVRGLPVWDRAAGSLVGTLGVLVLVWMTIPSLATAQGWPARAARGSAIVAAIDNVAPKQPARFAAWGRTISEAPYPTALAPLDDPPDPGAPPVAKMPAAVDERVRQSVVKVQGQACSQIQEGSGWVVEPHLVITNAHVVAGERNTLVTDPQGGHPHDATVVAFDARRDLAVLSVPNLDAPALVRARGKAGAIGAVYGHPGGNALRPAPARIGEEIRASGSDIYRSSSDVIRHVFILAADLHPGDSGAPLVNQSGAVMGVAFAIDPAKSGTAYALTDAEIDPVLQMVTGRRVSTGGCLVG